MYGPLTIDGATLQPMTRLRMTVVGPFMPPRRSQRTRSSGRGQESPSSTRTECPERNEDNGTSPFNRRGT